MEMSKTASITLGDGQEYTISIFNVGDFIEIEKKYGSLQLDSAKLEPVIFWLWLSLKKKHQITIEALYELIDSQFIAGGGIDRIFTTLSKLNGWDKESKNVASPATSISL